eukprot:CAMPEP_0178440364 /NCGR_PEP_ID=MMETSP0689_2-20121128/36741_1 /TAXON_ID=160604 /ORGANISM="Amphidinium massartii, Strain CS-259" /LENGTH=97 /DNA_ID=CAMNT_0020063137 /DNA_START=121 /DNA_END=410 /DNA_ORIENTATION=+
MIFWPGRYVTPVLGACTSACQVLSPLDLVWASTTSAMKPSVLLAESWSTVLGLKPPAAGALSADGERPRFVRSPRDLDLDLDLGRGDWRRRSLLRRS